MQIIKNVLGFNLRKCKFTKFPGGYAPDLPRFGMLLHSILRKTFVVVSKNCLILVLVSENCIRGSRKKLFCPLRVLCNFFNFSIEIYFHAICKTD